MSSEEHGVEVHAGRIAEIIVELESLPDSEAKTKALELVEHVDHLHRTCVWRLFEILSELGGKGLIDRIVSEPSVKTLFVLYDLIPSQPLRRDQRYAEAGLGVHSRFGIHGPQRDSQGVRPFAFPYSP